MRHLTVAWMLVAAIAAHGAVVAQQDRCSSCGDAVVRDRAPEDTIRSVPAVEKNYWLPAVEVVGLNFGVWSYNKYLSKEGWSNISWSSIERNFRTGFVWDYDGYLTNQFMHPYHGAAYFSTARTNGLGFWESAPYALGGSLMWEYFMEDEPPSYNDIVNTPVTGIILGEISLRVSDMILDESTVGSERFFREAGAMLVNPVHGFNRLIRGDMWRSGPPKERADFSLQLSAGVNNVFFSRRLANNTTYGFVGLDFGLGNLLEVSRHKSPFDHFTVHAELSITKDDNIAGIFASGVLWDANLAMPGRSEGVAGVYKEVDILINTVYKLSATSVTGQVIDRRRFSSTVTMQAVLSLSAILMGATNSQYASEYGKDYNIGPGASARAGADLQIRDYGSIHVSYKRYWIHTLSGAAGEEFVGLLKAGTLWELNAHLNLGLDFLLYERFGDYENFPDTQTANSAARVYFQFSV